MEYSYKANLHVHSNNSDGIHFPRFIVAYAKHKNIKVLSITDHNEIIGTIKAEKYAEKAGIIFFPGIELTFTIKGLPYELLAYFYEIQEIKDFYKEYRYNNGFIPHFKNVSEVIKIIKKYKGAVVAPHPFGRKGILRGLHNKEINIDAIEVINAFTGESRNIKAQEHIEKDNKVLKFGASDMHFFPADMGKIFTEISSNKTINKKEIWENITGQKRTLKFNPTGEPFLPHKIAFQKPLCIIVYILNYPRLYLRYRAGKKLVKNS